MAKKDKDNERDLRRGVHFHGRRDRQTDSKGRPLRYEVDIWEWNDFSRREGLWSLHYFDRKEDAIKFVRERMTQRLVIKCKVWLRKFPAIYKDKPWDECNLIFDYDTESNN